MRIAATAILLCLMVAGCFDLGSDRVKPKDYLTADDYSKWVIEVDFAQGEQPSGSLLDFAKGRLAPLVHKDSVDFRLDETLPAGDTTWSDSEISKFAADHQGTKTGGGTVVTHVLFLSGHSEHDTDNARVLGVTYGHDLIVIFSRSIKESCQAGPLGAILCSSPDPYFRAVLMHEFGHAIGLVDNGVPMVRNHEATSCGSGGQADEHHSTNQASVMYCQVETSAILLPPFQNGPPTDFDADDKADLRAAGGK